MAVMMGDMMVDKKVLMMFAKTDVSSAAKMVDMMEKPLAAKMAEWMAE